MRADVRHNVEHGRYHDDGREYREREHVRRPRRVDEEDKRERADDEVELIDARERRAAFAAGPPLEKGGPNVAAHRTERQRERGGESEERGEVDAENGARGAVEAIERQREDDADERADGRATPSLSVAEQPRATPLAAAVDGATAAREHCGVVRYVRGDHRPERRRDERTDHIRASLGGSIYTRIDARNREVVAEPT